MQLSVIAHASLFPSHFIPDSLFQRTLSQSFAETRAFSDLDQGKWCPHNLGIGICIPGCFYFHLKTNKGLYPIMNLWHLNRLLSCFWIVTGLLNPLIPVHGLRPSRSLSSHFHTSSPLEIPQIINRWILLGKLQGSCTFSFTEAIHQVLCYCSYSYKNHKASRSTHVSDRLIEGSSF